MERRSGAVDCAAAFDQTVVDNNASEKRDFLDVESRGQTQVMRGARGARAAQRCGVGIALDFALYCLLFLFLLLLLACQVRMRWPPAERGERAKQVDRGNRDFACCQEDYHAEH